MKAECAEHENIIVERVKGIIDERVELSVSNKMNPIYKWLTGTIVVMLGLFIGLVANNQFTLGKIETQNKTFVSYMEKQDRLNENLSKQLTNNASNLLIIALNLQHVDSTFTLPPNIWQLRGGEIKN